MSELLLPLIVEVVERPLFTKYSLLRPKTHNYLEAWNIRTMFETSKTAQVISKMYCDGQLKEMSLTQLSRAQWAARDQTHWKQNLLKSYVPLGMKRTKYKKVSALHVCFP